MKKFILIGVTRLFTRFPRDFSPFHSPRRLIFLNENCFLILWMAVDFFVLHNLEERNFSLFTVFLYYRVLVFFFFLGVGEEEVVGRP